MTPIENIRSLEEGHLLKGIIYLFGVPHHVDMVLMSDDELTEPFKNAPEVVHDIFESMQNYYEGAYQTVEVPGYPGRYALFVCPFAD